MIKNVKNTKNNTMTNDTIQSIELKTSKLEGKQLADTIADFLSTKKASDIIGIDLSKKTTIADYFIIASSNNIVHTKALAEQLDEYLSKDFLIEPLRRDGTDGKWVALDYSTVIVHIFERETREYYQLQQLWTGENNIIHY